MIKTNTMRTLVVALMALGAAAAHADVLTVSGQATAGSTNTFGPTVGSTFISDASSAGNGPGNNAFASAWGNDHGTYRASAYGSGSFDSSATFHRTLELINGSATAVHYTLNFFIYYGGLSIYNYAGVAGSGSAGYELSIKKNASSTLFASAALLDSTGAVSVTNALNGATGGGDSTSAWYYWNGTNVSLDLGVLGIGESMNIDFDLVTTASGSYATDSYSCGGYGGYGGYGGDNGYGYGGYGGGDSTCYRTADVNAGLGDPGSVDEFGMPPKDALYSISGVPASGSQVPLPGTLALFGLGLVGLGATRMRRRH